MKHHKRTGGLRVQSAYKNGWLILSGGSKHLSTPLPPALGYTWRLRAQRRPQLCTHKIRKVKAVQRRHGRAGSRSKKNHSGCVPSSYLEFPLQEKSLGNSRNTREFPGIQGNPRESRESTAVAGTLSSSPGCRL